MGSNLSDAQAGLLDQHSRSAVLMLDGDAAGQSATEAVTWRLSQVMETDVIHLKWGVQPDQLAPREINDILSGHLRPTRGMGR